MFLYEETHRYLKNDYQFFDTLKTKDCKIRRNCNLLTKVKFHELEQSSPLKWNLNCWILTMSKLIFLILQNVAATAIPDINSEINPFPALSVLFTSIWDIFLEQALVFFLFQHAATLSRQKGFDLFLQSRPFQNFHKNVTIKAKCAFLWFFSALLIESWFYLKNSQFNQFGRDQLILCKFCNSRKSN